MTLYRSALLALLSTLLSAAAHAASTTAALDGDWLCHTSSAQQAAGPRHYISITGGVLQTDTVDTDMRLTALGEHRYLGQWEGSAAPAQTQRHLHLQSPDTLRYTDTAPDTTNDTQHASATCQRLYVQTAPPAITKAQPDQPWVLTTLGQLRPTQPAVGYDQIFAKQAQYRATAAGDDGWKKAFEDWCRNSGLGGVRKKTVTATSQLNNPQSFACKKSPQSRQVQALKTAVIGPGGQLYLTDGHHSLSSLWEAPLRQGQDVHGQAGGSLPIPVRIQADYQHLNHASFWRAMRAQGYTWLQRPDGSPVTPADLPSQLGLAQGLQDDPYRSLMYFTRGVGYQAPENAPEFLEFYWANWLQSAPRNFDLQDYQLRQLDHGNHSDRGYLQAVHDAAALITQAPADTIVGPVGQTAAAMGQLPSLRAQALQQLATKNGQPGKLAAALAYRQQRAQP